MSQRPVWMIPAIATLLAAAAGVAILTVARGAGEASPARSGPVRVSGEAQIGGPFTLVNQDGETVTEEDFKGKAMLIYFGFTYCPDVCPFSLQIMGAALDQLSEAERARIQPILISVDPERDTPESLEDYVSSPSFPEGLIGLTGTPEQVRQAARAYRVHYAKVENESFTEYTVDHSSIIYLMDENGEFADVFPTSATNPDELAGRLEAFLADRRS
ncbi:MAG: SCO family protein [Oceanicaulis sp.]